MPPSSSVMGSANLSAPNISAKGWLPAIMNIAPGSISIPLKEKKSIQIYRGWLGVASGYAD